MTSAYCVSYTANVLTLESANSEDQGQTLTIVLHNIYTFEIAYSKQLICRGGLHKASPTACFVANCYATICS